MQITLLKKVIEDIAGKPATEIVDLLADKKDVNEFLIAKKLGMTINQTRNILYKLSDSGLVSFIRKKDKRKGWYIYFWTLNILKSLELLERKILSAKEQIENQLKNRKTKRFYICKFCNIEVREETALLYDFICPECGKVYELSENEELIRDMGSQISKLRKTLETIAGEKQKELEKIEKKGKSKKKKEGEKTKIRKAEIKKKAKKTKKSVKKQKKNIRKKTSEKTKVKKSVKKQKKKK